MTDCTVHIVDDEEAVRKSLAFMLTMNGFAVKMHQSAEAFLAFAPDVRNGILETDLRMPDMSGVDLLRNLGDRKNQNPFSGKATSLLSESTSLRPPKVCRKEAILSFRRDPVKCALTRGMLLIV